MASYACFMYMITMHSLNGLTRKNPIVIRVQSYLQTKYIVILASQWQIKSDKAAYILSCSKPYSRPHLQMYMSHLKPRAFSPVAACPGDATTILNHASHCDYIDIGGPLPVWGWVRAPPGWTPWWQGYLPPPSPRCPGRSHGSPASPDTREWVGQRMHGVLMRAPNVVWSMYRSSLSGYLLLVS